MASETLQVVSRDYLGRNTLVLDLNDGSTNTLKSGGVQFTPPAISPLLVGSVDSEGQDSTGKMVPNGQVAVSLYTRGTTADMLTTNVAALIATAYPAIGTTYLLKWIPFGATYPVYYEIVSPSGHGVPYDWHEYSYLRATVDLTYIVKPYALGDTTSTFDGFSTNSIADYTTTGGADLTITGGLLTMTANPTVAHRAWHTAKGYLPADGMMTVKLTTPSAYTAANFFVGLGLRRSAAADTWLEVVAFNDTLAIRKTANTGGSYTGLATTAAALAASATRWLRCYFEGKELRAELWTSQPTPNGTPAFTVSYTLTAGELVTYPSGVMGISLWQPGSIAGSPTLDDLWLEPWTYRAMKAPDYRAINGVPGDLDAVADVYLSHSAATATSTYKPGWGILSWYVPQATLATGVNFLPNWDFETDTNGWDTLNLGGLVTNVGGTLTSDATNHFTGAKALKCVGPALANWGPEAQVFCASAGSPRFRKGVTYVFSGRVIGTAVTGIATPVFGTSADNAVGGAITVSAAFQQFTVSWTPTADADVAFVAVRFSNASTTMYVDTCCVSEATTPATVTNPDATIPIGEIPAALMGSQYDPSGVQQLVGWSLQSDATASAARFKQYLGFVGAVPGTLTAAMFINPASVQPGYYGVFARVKMSNLLVNPRLTVSIADEYGNGQPQYTVEYGSAGKLLALPTTTSLWRWQFLGSVYLGTVEQARQKLVLSGAGSSGPGILGVDALHIVPMASMATRRWDDGDSPTTNGYSPLHNSYVGESAIFSSLRLNSISTLVTPPQNMGAPNGSMLGAQVRIPAGNSRVFLNLARVLPGDTTLATTSDEDTGAIYTCNVRFNFTPRYRFARGS